MRDAVRFLRRGEVVALDGFLPRATLLDYLRLVERSTGTKEGCAEGDCGACTVALGRLRGGRLVYEPVNACILLLGQVDGAEVVTVEDLADEDGLHPVQAAMVAHHGSQCGFCTPGFVMSLFTLYQEGARPLAREAVTDTLAGNLCRCTGYRPIVEAALAACAAEPADRFQARRTQTAASLAALADGADLRIADEAAPQTFFAAPASEDALARLYEAHPDATLVAGATDVGLWITKGLRDLDRIVWLGRVAGLDAIGEEADAVVLGATASHAAAAPALARIDPDLGELMRRFGSPQVRVSGTVGGSLANASPIGDLAPAFIALGATLSLRRGEVRRTLPLEAFFLAYGTQDRAPGEFVTAVRVPRLAAGEVFRCLKVTKRFDEDISAVCLALRLTLEERRIAQVRLAYGGMAGIPQRAAGAETALAGADLDRSESWEAALAALAQDFRPLDDHRASAAYRAVVAKNLLLKALTEIAGAPSRETRLIGHREAGGVNAPVRVEEGGLLRHVHRALPHDSAAKHVQGAAPYTDDLREPEGTLHVAVGGSPRARGRLVALDLAAVRAAPGVVAVLTAADVPGRNDVSPAFGDDELFISQRVVFHGQAVFAVVARTRDAARRAARLARIEVEAEPPSVGVDEALARGEIVLPDYAFGRGDAETALAAAPRELSGTFRVGGQEHFYLEGQVALAVPGEDGAMLVHSSTQHPSEVQHVVARVLGVPDARVTCEVRRMGGAFGGKESQATQWAALAALAAQVTGHPCKVRLDRDEDMALTGKRHDFRCDWRIGFDDEGRIAAYAVDLIARCGCSADLSQGVVDRAMFHADSAYFLPAARIASRRMFTNTVSNTAFRGFGGPQGMLAIEQAMDRVAWAMGRDPLDVRLANLYAPGRDVTPYGMPVEETGTLHAIVSALEASADYRERRAMIARFNAGSRFLKRGIALTPVKFGISFTLIHLNQAGALVHVYQDGSVHLNHGGTEMGQGLFTKVAQVVAEAFGLPLDAVAITATTTAKVPNTAPTAASAGTDLNAAAALDAAHTIRDRMAALAAERFGVRAEMVVFRDGHVHAGSERMPFGELARACVQARVQLSAAGFYRTPDITWDRATATGRPFFYFAYGAACAEVAIDTLTGENRVERVDILHDAGRSLNPAIDLGQIEGGFVQGMGWLTTEELVYDAEGRLRTHAPSTYKIPVASDVPADFRVALFDNPNPADTVYRSKAVGEPPIMLANAVFCALTDAVHALDPTRPVPLDAPATPEAILRACEAVRGREWGDVNPSANPWRTLLDAIAAEGAAALVTVQTVEGSAPREAGARLVARPSGGFSGTIGGGLLERDALAEAAQALVAGRGPARRLARLLGPDLGQCCGGRVALVVETFSAADRPGLEKLAAVADGPARSLACGLDRQGRVVRSIETETPGAGGWREPTGTDALPLLLFGAGHVGRALVLALAPLPVAVRWIDPRAEAFPSHVPANVVAIRADDPVAEVAAAPSGAAAVVMTHSHPLDLAVTAAALGRLDLPFVGLIGSATKRARFRARLRALGLPDARIAALACPIGIPGIAGKAPAIIAASVAAQVLQVREAAASDRHSESDAA